MQSKLVHTLLLSKGVTVPYKDIWNVISDLPYQSVGSGSPEILKTHKKDINKCLRENISRPADGGDWIETRKWDGYGLNQSVKWQYAKEAERKTPLRFMSPQRMEYLQKLDRD